MVKQAILNTIHNYLRVVEEAGIVVSQAILFGSFARGTKRPDSDIDLIVVASTFDDRKQEDVDLLWELRAFTDARIEPIACGEQQWQDDDVTPIWDIARREGIVIKPVIALA